MRTAAEDDTDRPGFLLTPHCARPGPSVTKIHMRVPRTTDISSHGSGDCPSSRSRGGDSLGNLRGRVLPASSTF